MPTPPGRERDDGGPVQAPAGVSVAEAEERIRTFAAADPTVTKGMLDILKLDPAFDPEHFLAGAKSAYEMIVTAFAEGNRKALKGLLNRDVFEGFSTAIADRESRGEQIDQSFVGIKSADIVEAELKNGMAQVTVKFVSELISVTRDADGDVVEGSRAINVAAFAIHSQVHKARPDVIAAAHAHSIFGRTWSALGRHLEPINQDACAFYQDHGIFPHFSGVVTDIEEGRRIYRSRCVLCHAHAGARGPNLFGPDSEELKEIRDQGGVVMQGRIPGRLVAQFNGWEFAGNHDGHGAAGLGRVPPRRDLPRAARPPRRVRGRVPRDDDPRDGYRAGAPGPAGAPGRAHRRAARTHGRARRCGW